MVSMDSCLALSMNPQVLITTTLASSVADSCTALMPLPRSWVSNTSESTWFLEQPRVTILTFVFLFPFVFMKERSSYASNLYGQHTPEPDNSMDRDAFLSPEGVGW